MFALTQGLRRASQIKPNGISTRFSGRRRTWLQTIDRVSRVAGALFALECLAFLAVWFVLSYLQSLILPHTRQQRADS